MKPIPQRKPLFIAVEGIDGVGKTTVVAAICKFLTDGGYDFVATKGLGGTPFGAAIRDIHISGLGGDVNETARGMLVSAARSDLIAQVIRPALAAGKIVICDRYSLTTAAYSRIAPRIDDIVSISNDGLYPNFTFVLDAPIEVSRTRLEQRAAAGEALDHLELAPDEDREGRRQTMLRWYYAHEHASECISVTASAEVVCARVLNTLLKLLYMNGVNDEPMPERAI